MPTKDFYAVLGLEKGAPPDEVKRAYRRLARKYHPDVNGQDKNAEERFKEVSNAFRVLSDPEKRKLYDEFGEDAERFGYDPEKAKIFRDYQRQARNGFGGARSGGKGGFGADLSELFGDLFGGGREPFSGFGSDFDGLGFDLGGAPGRGSESGADITFAMEIDFKDAVLGGRREISLVKPARCQPCGGLGRQTVAGGGRCEHCSGSGQVHVSHGPLQLRSTCGYCGGSGKQPGPACTECDGRGWSERPARLDVNIPPGVEDGQKIRLQGQGVPGRNGGPPGDLLIDVRIRPDRRYRREGADLYMELPVTLSEAMFGADIEVPTLHGRVKLKIPAGAQSGQKLRIRGKGVPRRKSGAGDLYVSVSVKLPSAGRDPETARKAADALERLYAGSVRSDFEDETP